MTEDIDLSEYENLFIPIMDGTFDGGGHTITGIRLQEEMSDYGFFRYVGPNGTVAKPDGRGNGDPVGKIRKTSVSLLVIIKEQSVAAPAVVH